MTRDGIKAIRPLIEQLPDFYHNSPEVVDLQNAFTKQINSAWMQREEFLNQLNVQTATWSLPIWEYLYGIEADTLEMMKNVAKSFCNSDVEIIEYNDEFRFEIKFDGTASAIENKDGFLKAIRELKPAHLQETLIEMTSLPSTLYVGTAIGSYKQEVVCNVNI